MFMAEEDLSLLIPLAFEDGRGKKLPAIVGLRDHNVFLIQLDQLAQPCARIVIELEHDPVPFVCDAP